MTLHRPGAGKDNRALTFEKISQTSADGAYRATATLVDIDVGTDNIFSDREAASSARKCEGEKEVMMVVEDGLSCYVDDQDRDFSRY